MELKKEVKDYLVKQNEKEKLERILKNSKLKSITIYTNPQVPICKHITETLKSEGVKYIEKSTTENQNEWNEISTIVNMNMVPLVIANKNYLIYKRDFQNAQQLIGAIQVVCNPKFKNQKNEDKILEYIKTNTYQLWNKVDQLEKKISPLVDVMNSVLNDIENEEDSE